MEVIGRRFLSTIDDPQAIEGVFDIKKKRIKTTYGFNCYVPRIIMRILKINAISASHVSVCQSKCISHSEKTRAESKHVTITRMPGSNAS